MQFKNTRQRKSVDLTPMVSVVFLLIIFFLIVGTVRSPTFWNIELVKSDSQDQTNPQMINIYLDQNGKFAYKQETVDVAKLSKILTNIKSKPIIQIHADFRADTLHLIKLLDSIQSAAINRVVLITNQTTPQI